MERPPQDPGRKTRPHLPSRVFPNQSVIQYVTVCTKQRRPILARPEVHEIVINAWKKADHWLIGRYAIMPEHIHLFCAPACFPIEPLKPWVDYWRAEVTRHWPWRSEKPIWQKDFDDRQLRNGESYHRKWMYVWENPAVAGLVKNSADWPYQGELNVLQWHEQA